MLPIACYNEVMNPIDWAKKNKKQLVQEIVGTAKPSNGQEKPVAVFAAGIPGAGKTELLDRLLSETSNIVRIDMDEIVKLFDGYTPQNYYKFRGAANIIVDEAVIFCRQNRLDFILDGTFGSGRAIENVRSALKRHEVVIFYVWKEPTIAWQHTIDRQLVTKRGVDKEGFVEACLNVPRNLKEVRTKFGDKVSILAIKKDLDSDNFQITRDAMQIDKLLEVEYNKDYLERVLL